MEPEGDLAPPGLPEDLGLNEPDLAEDSLPDAMDSLDKPDEGDQPEADALAQEEGAEVDPISTDLESTRRKNQGCGVAHDAGGALPAPWWLLGLLGLALGRRARRRS